MNSKKPKWKRLLSSLLMLAMLATLFPVSAFAIEYEKDTYLSPHNFAIDDSGNLTDTLTLPDGFDNDVLDDRTGNNWALPENLNVDLWVYSDDMSEEEISNGTAPYVKDIMGRTWTLSKISITNKSTPTEGQTLIELLTISPETSKIDYVVDLSKISIDARSLGRYSYYDIYYLWELTEGDPTPTQYQVTYDLNLPSELSGSKTLFPVYRVDDRENMDVLSEDGQLYVVEAAVDALSGSVYENVPFTVADFSNTLYVDFLVFDENSYYDFDGWYIEGSEDTLYQTGEVLTADDSLAGDGNTISFKAKWTEITPLEIDEDTKWEALGELAARPPILSADTRNVADNVLITQWTDTDANLSGNLKSGETVMLDEDRTIYYQMSATVNSALYSSYFSPASMPFEDFMTFTLSLDVDDDLEFVADDNGQATLTFNSPIFKVTGTNITGATWSNYPDENGDSTITFDPDNIRDNNVITVTVKWNEKVENNYITPSGTMTLSGFAFKLKDGAASEDMEISTSGNITGSLDLKKPNGINQRYYYQTVLNLLNSNFYGYQEEFGGDASNPTAYVHAMQFTDLVTSNYDLSQDAKAVLDSNDAAATYTQYTITATAGENGSITPGTTQVYKGDDQPFTITPSEGYEIADVLVDGASVGAVTSYTFSDVQADHTISVTFKEPEAVTHTITATAGSNGSISPSGTVTVEDGTDQTFTITPSEGFEIADVLVDGASVGAVSSYTFENVTGDHTIAATFARDSGGGGVVTPTQYTITAEAGDGGSINPDGRVRVDRGDDQTFRITPDDGYEIADVLVDGESVGAVSSYTFEDVRANHTIEVVFEAVEEVPGVADPDDTGVSDWLNTEDHNAYLSGYPGSLFGPDNNMTRAEVAQMFYNLLLDKDVAITVTFDDVPADAWYAEAVNTLASLGMITGVGNNQFEPERSITRAEFTTIAMRFTDGVLDGENIFPDVNPDDWFYDYVVGSIQYGWINGYPDGTFGPNDPISRAEVTTITNRMLGRSADEAFVDSNEASLVRFGDITDRHWAYYQVMEATNAHDYTETNGVEDWTSLN